MMKQAAIPNQIIWYVAPTFKMEKEICWSDLKQTLAKYNWIEDQIKEIKYLCDTYNPNATRYTDEHTAVSNIVSPMCF